MAKAKASFHWDDPLLLDQQLTDDERMVRDAARAYCQERLAPRVLEAFRNGTTDPAIFREMGELGLLGPTIPEQYGGAGLNYVCYGLIAREVERVDSGYRSMMSVQISLVMVPINEFGTEAQKQKYLPKLATGEWIGCFGLTEPEPRLRPRQHGHARAEGRRRLRADRRQDVDHQLADRRRVRGLGQGRRRRDPRLRAREGREGPERAGDPRQGRPARLDHRRDRDGRRVLPGRERLPRSARPEGPVHLPELARYGIAWGALGAAEDCWHRARQYMLDRKQFGRPLAANQLIQKKLADMQTEITLGLQGCLRLGRMKDEGTAVGRDHLDHEAQLLRQGARHRPRWRAT